MPATISSTPSSHTLQQADWLGGLIVLVAGSKTEFGAHVKGLPGDWLGICTGLGLQHSVTQ